MMDTAEAKAYKEENFAHEDDAYSLKYFEEQISDNNKFWARVGTRPDFNGKSVLELGSGHGALSIDAALHGARRVLGLDLMSSRVAFAKRIASKRYPQIADRVDFMKANIQEVQLDEPVDIVLSKDTFEHIMDLDGVLAAIAKLLRPDGMLIVGIGPFYFSPFGDHGLHAIGKERKFPWMHLLMGDERVVAHYNSHHPGVTCKTIYDMGMNKLLLQDYLDAFTRNGFKFATSRVNASDGGSKLYPVLNALRHVPGLGRYTTTNLYAKLILDPARKR